MNATLSVLLVVLAVLVVGWGFERYRTQFVKSELTISLVVAAGLFTIAVSPNMYDVIGNVLNIENRFITISLVSNVAFIGILFYVVKLSRENKREISNLVRNLSVDQVSAEGVQSDGGYNTISIVIPAYNEEDTIQPVLQSLPESIRGYSVEAIVVSDGSADSTARQADINGTTVVEHPLNQGQGGALRTGFRVASKRGADIVVTMDGDGQHPADELERLVTPIIEDRADYVMGSRRLGTDYSGNNAVRRAGIQGFTWFINRLTKAEITDCTNGYRAIRGTAVEEKLTLTEERFSAPELIIEARKNGLRIEEIPITVEERKAGRTKKPKLGYAIGLFRTIFITWIR
ncbi:MULTISPECIES: DUF2304 family protein [unclassified Haladaptatus]|uniref:DUF2304 family protein n=1 Tax=unclassified Haladaptatus TaxID=2622732 RepID=UPI00209BEECF|nr:MULTISPECIES: DUF2304 family protein [unclassified Haladaptatus]MCO8244763.1 DUF2304 family protein [Haladaptatus sp. AB643]MCO8255725.1 DUF2304 family protein [Haladaptatus sp. AB618]